MRADRKLSMASMETRPRLWLIKWKKTNANRISPDIKRRFRPDNALRKPVGFVVVPALGRDESDMTNSLLLLLTLSEDQNGSCNWLEQLGLMV
jgi:hypothetical protein